MSLQRQVLGQSPVTYEYDHAGNLDAFPNAMFHLQDREMAFATGKHMCQHCIRVPYEVEDVVKINLHFLDNPDQSGIFNVGTGRAQTFNDVAVATVNACRRVKGEPELSLAQLHAEGILEYIDFPDALKGKYQNFTQADIANLHAAGYDAPLLTVEEGCSLYVQHLLKSA